MCNIVYFSLEELKSAIKITHDHVIKAMNLDVNGSLLCFLDHEFYVYVYDPIKNLSLKVITSFYLVEGIIWNQNFSDRTLFITYSKNNYTIYVFWRYFIQGNLKLKKVI